MHSWNSFKLPSKILPRRFLGLKNKFNWDQLPIPSLKTQFLSQLLFILIPMSSGFFIRGKIVKDTQRKLNKLRKSIHSNSLRPLLCSWAKKYPKSMMACLYFLEWSRPYKNRPMCKFLNSNLWLRKRLILCKTSLTSLKCKKLVRDWLWNKSSNLSMKQLNKSSEFKTLRSHGN